jgi:hypothetical protein
MASSRNRQCHGITAQALGRQALVSDLVKERPPLPVKVRSSDEDSELHKPNLVEEAPMERRHVEIDLHRRRSMIFVMNSAGEKLSCVPIGNEPVRQLEEVSRTGDDAEVVVEATYGWYWAADLLQENRYSVHLAHPAGNDWGKRRVKNDERDAHDLADLLRLGRLAEAWIAPKPVRELRELVRYRVK